jgi:hypothetical protein
LGTVAYAQLAAGVTNGAIGELQLANDAVTKDKLLDGAVTSGKLDTDAVTEDKLAAGAVTTNKIGAGAVTESKLGSGAVTTNKIGSGAVTEKKIEDGAVTANKLAADAVNSSKILDGSVTVNDVATNAFWRTDGNTAVPRRFVHWNDGRHLGSRFAVWTRRCFGRAVFPRGRHDHPDGTIQRGVFRTRRGSGRGFLNGSETTTTNVTVGRRHAERHQRRGVEFSVVRRV